MKTARNVARPSRFFQVGQVVALQGKSGLMCADEGGRVNCNRPWIRSWEKFTVVDGGSTNVFALKGGRHNHAYFCTNRGDRIACDSKEQAGEPSDAQQFKVMRMNNKL